MEQIEITRRYLERIRQIYKGAPYIENKQYYADDVCSFFIHCYHIKDWIIKLNKLNLSKKEINNFIRENIELKICADLCNGQKHCKLKEKMMWTNKQPHIAGKSFESSGVNNVMHTIKGTFTVLAENKFYDALELAEKCMSLWDEYINKLKEKVN